jgi:hypothetical protein
MVVPHLYPFTCAVPQTLPDNISCDKSACKSPGSLVLSQLCPSSFCIQEITRHESSCYLSSCSIRFHSQCRGCLGILVVDIWVSFLLLDYIVDALNICVEGLWQWFSVNGYANTSTAVAPDSLL